MVTFIRMPQKGLTEESAILTKWYAAEGDVVKEGQYIFALETGKAAFDVEAEAGGTILKLLANEGDEVPIKQIICVIGDPGEAYTIPTEEGDTAADGAASSPASAGIPAPAASSMPASVLGPSVHGGEKPSGKISPRAKRLAAKEALSLENVTGSGPNGRIIEEDVIAVLQNRPRLSAAAGTDPVSLSPAAFGSSRPVL